MSQEQHGDEKVIEYYSKTFSKEQRNYCVTRKELFAVVKAVENYHTYLYGRRFIIRTDHAALKWLMNFKNPEGQVARWLEKLQTYDFEIRHRSGKSHGNADALSRRPCSEEYKSCCKQEERELKVNLTKVQEFEEVDCSYSLEQVKKAQTKDADLKLIIDWMKNNKRPEFEEVSQMNSVVKAYLAQWNSLKLRDEVLYRIWEDVNGKEAKEKLVLPKELRLGVLQQFHNSSTGGHFGIKKTHDKVRGRFYWIGCREDVENFYKTCAICNSRKGQFERIAVDILGPLPVTNRGNKYLLVVMDYFTKWPEVMPIPNQETETVAEALVENVFSRFGLPMELHSDQGRNFESELFGTVMSIMGINKTRTTALHPQSDGLVERFKKTILDYLSKFIDENQRDWDKKIHFCMLAYRSAVNETTQYTPAKMMMGRELRLPVDLIVGQSPDERKKSLPEWVVDLQERLWIVHESARDNMISASDRMKARYDLRATGPKFKVGDLVWFYNPKRRKGKCPKLQRDWEGPYEIIKCLNDVVFRIRMGKNGKPKVVHSDRLFPYQGRCSPRTSNLKEGEV